MPATPEADLNKQAAVFSEWLRTRMEASGYATQGGRPGGQVRLAKDANLTASILSRALNGQSVPSSGVVVQLSRALGASPIEALRKAGYEDLAMLIVEESTPGAASEAADPIAARIEHAAELTSSQRAWLIGFYERRRNEAAGALAREVDELIRFVSSAT